MTTLTEIFSMPATAQDPYDVVPAGGPVYSAAKRLMDIVLASVLLAILSPVMLLAALLVKLTSRGPVLFHQERAGLDGRPFRMYKFRSMRENAENDYALLASSKLNKHNGTPVFKIPNDPRFTSIGKFLRRSSIDELPQLFNVLRGEMTLVGPRPLWLPEARKTGKIGQMRGRVKPGLTCLWQISGRSELPYDEWVRLDLYYIRHRGFLLDLLIMLQTIPAVLSGHGAY